MADEKKTERITAEAQATVKVEIVGPSSVVCAAGTFEPGKSCMLTAAEFESVKTLVKKL